MPATLLLNRNLHRCLIGHPWIYRSEIQRLEGEPVDGDLVDVLDRGRFVGRGWYGVTSQIAVRLLTRKDEVVDPVFLRRRLADALAYRERILPGRPCRRLVSSEGDRLPGFIVDQYHNRLVVQCTTAAVEAHRKILIDLITELVNPVQVVERSDAPVRRHEGLSARTGVLSGIADTTLRARIGRIEVPVDLMDPHKTGTYLDQQANHEALMAFVKPGARVLDVCCHLGGFALHALLAGAASATGIDQAESSIAGARQAASWADLHERFTGVVGNAFDWLSTADEQRSRFDVVVLDPPSFTRTKDGIEAALRGYKEMHLRALHRLEADGVLATFTCSHHISPDEFTAMIAAAATDAGRTLRLEATLDQAADHPVLAGASETGYLRGYVYRVLP